MIIRQAAQMAIPASNVQSRRLRRANWLGVWAACVEAASRSAGLMGLGGSPCSGATSVRVSGSIDGIASEQRARYKGDAAPSYKASAGADLDDFAEIHDHHAIADVADDVEVMRDEHGNVRFISCFRVAEQIEDLRFHRFIECGDGFVQDHDPWRERERACDVDPLALAA